VDVAPFELGMKLEDDSMLGTPLSSTSQRMHDEMLVDADVSMPIISHSDNGGKCIWSKQRKLILDNSSEDLSDDGDDKHICSTCHKRFKRPSLSALPVVFRCPFPNCGREFKVNFRYHASSLPKP
jgi:hypothetical protein